MGIYMSKKQFMEIWNKTVDELFNIAFVKCG